MNHVFGFEKRLRSMGVASAFMISILVGSVALAQTAAVDDFNSYSDGTLAGLNGGSGWTGAWSTPSNGNIDNYLVQGDVTYEGTKAVSSSYFNGNISRNIAAPATSGTVTIAMRRNTNSVGISRTVLEAQSPNTQYVVEMSSAGNIVLLSADGDVNVASYSPDTWYLIDIQYNTHVPKYRVRVNGGAWSSWKAPSGDSVTAPVNKVYFDEYYDPSTPAGTINYWDDLSIR
jgi:hypothetical protein